MEKERKKKKKQKKKKKKERKGGRGKKKKTRKKRKRKRNWLEKMGKGKKKKELGKKEKGEEERKKERKKKKTKKQKTEQGGKRGKGKNMKKGVGEKEIENGKKERKNGLSPQPTHPMAPSKLRGTHHCRGVPGPEGSQTTQKNPTLWGGEMRGISRTRLASQSWKITPNALPFQFHLTFHAFFGGLMA